MLAEEEEEEDEEEDEEAMRTRVVVETKSWTLSHAGLFPPLLTAFDPLLPTVVSSTEDPLTGAHSTKEFLNLILLHGYCVLVWYYFTQIKKIWCTIVTNTEQLIDKLNMLQLHIIH